MAKDYFANLGIPFPLYEAPIETASSFVGVETCSVCHTSVQYCFRLGIGDDVIVVCTSCGRENVLDADDRESGICEGCSTVLDFPLDSESELYVCYNCLRAGKVALTIDTELGMIRWEDAQRGVTHGLPSFNDTTYELSRLNSDGWVGVRLPKEEMLELLRTPEYTTWQGGRWLFHCKKPMVYVGEWLKSDFMARSPDGDGEKYFTQISDATDRADWIWDGVGEAVVTYAFRCQVCDQHRAHFDFD